MRQGEIVELEVPSSPEYVSIVRSAIEGVARRMKFDADSIEDLKLAVGEACNNAVQHGCPRNGCSNVMIKFQVVADGLMIEVKNSIDCCDSPAVPNRVDGDLECGRGLFLIRQLMDEVNLLWDAEMATIKMLKRLSKTAA